MEEWVPIEDLGKPGYSISNLGRVRNEVSGLILKPSRNQSGLCKVGLVDERDNKQHSVSLALLVANTFLPKPVNERFNTPINLDGYRFNNRVDNLVWRPRWFAIKYHQQFYNDRRGFIVPVFEIHTRETFETSWEAAIKYGLLDRDISTATINRTYVFPTGQEFRVIE